MLFKNIETERLILRPVTEEDIQDFFELDSNPNVHKYLGNKPVQSIEASEAMVASILKQYKTNGIGRLALIEKSSTKFIGWAGLKYEDNLRKDFNYFDLGYRLKEQFWGKGFATEAALASLNYGFKDLKLKEIGAAANINHIASNTILSKIGMQATGTFEHEGDSCYWYEMTNPYE